MTKTKNEAKIETPSTLDVGGVIYKLTDFHNNFSFRQQRCAKKILAPLAKVIARSVKTDSTTDKTDGKVEIDMQELLANVMEIDIGADILALIYIEGFEETFRDETYEKRLERFLNATPTKGMEAAIMDFFASKYQFIMESSQIYFKGMGATAAA